MSVIERPVVFETSDGKEFDTKEKATRHQAVLDARKVYEDGCRDLRIAVLADQTTADGKPLDLSERHWYLSEWAGDPMLIDVQMYRWWERELVMDDDGVPCIKAMVHGQSYEFKPSDLYAERANAEKAMAAAIEKRIKRLLDLKLSLKNV